MTSTKALVCLATLCILPSCGEDVQEEDHCLGPEILPHASPVFLGEPYPSDGEPDPGNGERTPYEWVLLLQSSCDRSIVIEDVCIVGDPTKNGDDVAQFQLDGPRPAKASFGEDAALRLTYGRNTLAADTDQDGKPDPDSVAVIIQSNARNFPTLVVPVCARLLPDGTPREGVTCTTPVVVEPGTRDDSLCP